MNAIWRVIFTSKAETVFATLEGRSNKSVESPSERFALLERSRSHDRPLLTVQGRTAGEMRAAAARAHTAMTQEYLLTQHAHVLSFEQKVEAHDNLRHMGVVKQWHVPNTVTAVQALTPPPEPPLRVPQGPRSAAYQPPPPPVPPSRTASAFAYAHRDCN